MLYRFKFLLIFVKREREQILQIPGQSFKMTINQNNKFEFENSILLSIVCNILNCTVFKNYFFKKNAMRSLFKEFTLWHYSSYILTIRTIIQFWLYGGVTFFNVVMFSGYARFCSNVVLVRSLGYLFIQKLYNRLVSLTDNSVLCLFSVDICLHS